MADCGCPEQVVSHQESRTIFYGLNHEEEYFPMVSRPLPLAFFGLPPPALRPRALEKIVSITPPSSIANSPARLRGTSNVLLRNPSVDDRDSDYGFSWDPDIDSPDDSGSDIPSKIPAFDHYVPHTSRADSVGELSSQMNQLRVRISNQYPT